MSNSYTRTLGSVTGSVRSLGDYPDSGNPDDYMTGDFLVAAVASAYKEAYELLAEADPDRLTTTSGTLVQSATGSLPLPTDIYRLRWIDVSVGGQWQRLVRDTPGLMNTPWESTTGGTPSRYRLEGPLAYVDPPVPANTSVRVTYVPAPAQLSGSDETLDGVAGLDELVIWTALRDCCYREERSTVEADAKIARETARLTRMARDRDSGQAIRLEDPMTGGWISNRRRYRR